MFIAGRGAVISGAEEAIAKLADRAGALLATSVCGHGLFAGDPWSLGISGGFASPASSELVGESDLIVGFGVSLTHWTTKRGKLIAPGTTVAQIDIEGPKLGYHTPVDIAVLADARAAAEALLAELGREAGCRAAGATSTSRRACGMATTIKRPTRTYRTRSSSTRAP